MGILQARILEWDAMPSSRRCSRRDQTQVMSPALADGFFTTSAACLQFSSVQLLSCVRLFATPWTVAHQVSLSITNPCSLVKLRSIMLVMPSNHLILCHPLLLLPSIFPSMSQLFTSGGQSTGASASASVLPMNIQD